MPRGLTFLCREPRAQCHWAAVSPAGADPAWACYRVHAHALRTPGRQTGGHQTGLRPTLQGGGLPALGASRSGTTQGASPARGSPAQPRPDRSASLCIFERAARHPTRQTRTAPTAPPPRGCTAVQCAACTTCFLVSGWPGGWPGGWPPGCRNTHTLGSARRRGSRRQPHCGCSLAHHRPPNMMPQIPIRDSRVSQSRASMQQSPLSGSRFEPLRARCA